MPVEPPGERAEPEDGAMQKGEMLGEGIAADDMRDFVDDDRVEFGVVPLAPVRGEQDHGTQGAQGYGHENQFGFGGLWNEIQARGEFPD